MFAVLKDKKDTGSLDADHHIKKLDAVFMIQSKQELDFSESRDGKLSTIRMLQQLRYSVLSLIMQNDPLESNDLAILFVSGPVHSSIRAFANAIELFKVIDRAALAQGCVEHIAKS